LDGLDKRKIEYMNKIEKLFTEAGLVWEDDTKECANITEEIAIKFADWLWKNVDEKEMSKVTWKNLFEEFKQTL